MAEMVAIKNGSNQTIGYRGVKYVNGTAVDNGKSYDKDKKQVGAKQDAIVKAQSVANARRNNPRNNPNLAIARQFGNA